MYNTLTTVLVLTGVTVLEITQLVNSTAARKHKIIPTLWRQNLEKLKEKKASKIFILCEPEFTEQHYDYLTAIRFFRKCGGISFSDTITGLASAAYGGFFAANPDTLERLRE